MQENKKTFHDKHFLRCNRHFFCYFTKKLYIFVSLEQNLQPTKLNLENTHKIQQKLNLSPPF